MQTVFSRKTNKKTNSIFQMKTQIHRRADAIRKQQLRGGAITFNSHPESELFDAYPSLVNFEMVGKEPRYESY